MYKKLKKKIKNILNGEQRTQLGSFVLRFSVKEKRIYFITFKHHNKECYTKPETPETFK